MLGMVLSVTAQTEYVDLSADQEAALAGGLLGAVFGALAIVAVVTLVLVVLSIIARWKIFSKAGEDGWKSLIPIYSDYVEWRISWKNVNLFWVMLGLQVLSGVMSAFGGSGDTVTVMSVVGSLCLIASVVLKFVQVYKLFRSFGKDVGWFIGYIFANNIMLLVLGFGSSEYEGPQD